MKLLLPTTIFALLALCTSTPLPHPYENTTSTHHSHTKNTTAPYALSKRLPNQSGVYLCTDSNFGGQCTEMIRPFGACIDLLPPYWLSISSVGPDFGSICSFYSSHACYNHGNMLNKIVYPGQRNLAEGMDNRIMSYKCDATG